MPRFGIDHLFEKRLSALVNSGERTVLQNGLKGVEKESLRVSASGELSRATHPRALGSALSSEHITTDFSEALIELVTPAFSTTWELLQYLLDLHQFVYRHLDEELLWATSMPCRIGADADIPIAQYGASNVARMKTIYRRGLRLRYGSMMQAISGVHFNYSFPKTFWEVYAAAREARSGGREFVSASYFDLLRNYRRYGWLVPYLFGVSPAVSRSFIRGRDERLVELGPDTLYEPYGTSLRMSDIGYRNRNQGALDVSFNSLEEYVRDLTHAIMTPYAPYQALGVRVDGEYRQLNANVLQIENEYYCAIRPKRVARSGERPTKALRRAGVEYVEVRALDVSAFDPVGVNQHKLRFLEAFLALCLLKRSDPIDAGVESAIDQNHLLVARRGREPGLKLTRDGRSVSMVDWAEELLDSMSGIAELLDRGEAAKPYQIALATQAQKVRDPRLTPSARMLAELEGGTDFVELALRMSKLHKAYFLDLYPPNAERQAELAREASESLAIQAAMEASEARTFEQYLADYFAD